MTTWFKARSLIQLCAWAAWLALAAHPVYAHHSNTPFDMTTTLHTTGTVEKADFKNPHSTLTLRIASDDGDSVITFEGHSLATLRHYGLTPAMVKIGQPITISYAPRRDGRPGGIFLSVTTSDGSSLDFSHLGYE
ncbi:MAG: hypothetical protein H6978_07105 [Gammaproteobacteria bacterium]|nr:hypothetical protein [Gammaproteobacteria bacterium]